MRDHCSAPDGESWRPSWQSMAARREHRCSRAPGGVARRLVSPARRRPARCCPPPLMDKNEPGTLSVAKARSKELEEFMGLIEIPNACDRRGAGCRRIRAVPRSGTHCSLTGGNPTPVAGRPQPARSDPMLCLSRGPRSSSSRRRTMTSCAASRTTRCGAVFRTRGRSIPASRSTRSVPACFPWPHNMLRRTSLKVILGINICHQGMTSGRYSCFQ